MLEGWNTLREEEEGGSIWDVGSVEAAVKCPTVAAGPVAAGPALNSVFLLTSTGHRYSLPKSSEAGTGCQWRHGRHHGRHWPLPRRTQKHKQKARQTPEKAEVAARSREKQGIALAVKRCGGEAKMRTRRKREEGKQLWRGGGGGAATTDEGETHGRRVPRGGR